MKIFSSLLFALILLTAGSAAAGHITPEQAGTVARSFLFERASQHQSVTFEELRITSSEAVPAGGSLAFYIINFDLPGFVIVSADDRLTPVIGYSFRNNFVTEAMPEHLHGWLDQYIQEITYHRDNQTEASAEIRADWQYYLHTAPGLLKPFKGKDVAPIVASTWDQGKFYNDFCPKDNGVNVPVGCVATAMAQVMFHFRYPLTGNGSHGYTSNYGFHSVNYGSTTYDWHGMRNSLASYCDPVALLSYHAAVSVNMDFGPDGSGASTSTAASSLRQYFGYASSTQYVQRMSYSSSAWLNLIKGNIDNGRPCMYSGYPTGGGAGHCWVVDGYQGTDYLHMNWGWGGNSDGYYTINALNPPGGGTNFNSGHGAIVNIYPGNNYPYDCPSQMVISNYTAGTLDDGSGPAETYSPNRNCSWLITPDDSVKSIKLTFHRFDTESATDVLKVYGGPTTASPLLGTYSGQTLPAALTHNGSKLLITWETDGANEAGGWYLSYSCTLPTFCNNHMMTALQGTISDGSGPKNYNPSSICLWFIQPPGAASIALTFTAFDLEPVNDYLKIYDLYTEELLATYSGNTLPPPVVTTTGGMYIEFKTDGKNNFQGWEANYVSLGVGMEENEGLSPVVVFPNPATDGLTVRFTAGMLQPVSVRLFSPDGKAVYEDIRQAFAGQYTGHIDTGSIAPGLYFLEVRGDHSTSIQKIILH